MLCVECAWFNDTIWFSIVWFNHCVDVWSAARRRGEKEESEKFSIGRECFCLWRSSREYPLERDSDNHIANFPLKKFPLNFLDNLLSPHESLQFLIKIFSCWLCILYIFCELLWPTFTASSLALAPTISFIDQTSTTKVLTSLSTPHFFHTFPHPPRCRCEWERKFLRDKNNDFEYFAILLTFSVENGLHLHYTDIYDH